MKKHINIILKAFIMVQAFMLSSCHVLHDDMSECDLFLNFRYDYNLSYEDWFGEQVEEIKVFIFDNNGKYVQTFNEVRPALALNGYKMQIPFHMKGYSAVVIAGKTESDYTLPQMEVGDSVDKLMLHYKPTGNSSNHRIAALWHSSTHVLSFPEKGGLEQTIGLVRNTNDFHISLRPTGVELVDMANFNINIKGANGSYDSENKFPQGIPDIIYLPTAGGSSATANIYTMRLVHGALITISARENLSGRDILIEGKKEIDLIKLLLLNKPANMTEQEYLDRRYIWDITLNYNADTYMAVSIVINGWTHWFHNTDL